MRTVRTEDMGFHRGKLWSLSPMGAKTEYGGGELYEEGVRTACGYGDEEMLM